MMDQRPQQSVQGILNGIKTPQTVRSGATTPRAYPDGGPLSPSLKSTSDEVDGPSIQRKGSFSFLRGGRTRERSASTGGAPRRRLSKKNTNGRSKDDEMRPPPVPPQPPSIPPVSLQPQIQTFGGENARSNSFSAVPLRTRADSAGPAYYHGMPAPPVPPVPPLPGAPNGTNQMPWDRSESMANRSRYSYASTAMSTVNGPRKIRRRKEPSPFNILVIGSQGCGKSSFVNFLQSAIAPVKKQRPVTRDPYERPPAPSESAFPGFKSTYVETEFGLERVGVTLWDSESLDQRMVDLQSKELVTFIESKFEDTYVEESKVVRAPGFRDTHIHCAFLLLDPARLERNRRNDVKPASEDCLDQAMDLTVLQTLKNKTTVIPIIAKADTMTEAQSSFLRRAVWRSLKQHNLDALEISGPDDSESAADEDEHTPVAETEGPAFPLVPGRSVYDHTKSVDADDRSMISHLDSASSSDSSSFGTEHKTTRSREQAVDIPSDIPFTIISPDTYEPNIVGRRYAWGIADPYNPAHCDFNKLKDAVFSEWRTELCQISRERWYERWRTSRLDRKYKRHGVTLERDDFNSKIWQAHAQPWARGRNQSVA